MNYLNIAINECVKNDYFHFPTLFLKESSKGTDIIFIGITSEDSQTKRTSQKNRDLSIEIYEISINYCMSLILSHDILLTSLFSKTVCLKDDLDICRKILLSLKPILIFNNLNHAPILPHIWDASIKEPKYPDDELSIRFYNISGDISLIFKVLLPIQGLIKDYAHKTTESLQFYNINERKDAILSIYFNDSEQRRHSLLQIQKMLYIQSTELNCQNIRIPYHKVASPLKVNCRESYFRILDLTIEFQNIVLSGDDEKKCTESILTEMLYAYILNAKIFFPDYLSFKSFNDSVYKRYTNVVVSDTIKYLLSNNVVTYARNKTAREHYTLCMSNAQSLFTNYFDLLTAWKDFRSCKQEYYYYIKQLNYIKEMTCEAQRNEIISEIVDQLFHSFDIPSYYHSYIPFTVNFVKNEI